MSYLQSVLLVLIVVTLLISCVVLSPKKAAVNPEELLVFKKVILEVIRKNQEKFHKCYKSSLEDESSLKGGLKVEWQILSSGSVTQVRVIEESVGSPVLSKCITDVISQLPFPPSPQGKIIKPSFSFVFDNSKKNNLGLKSHD